MNPQPRSFCSEKFWFFVCGSKQGRWIFYRGTSIESTCIHPRCDPLHHGQLRPERKGCRDHRVLPLPANVRVRAVGEGERAPRRVPPHSEIPLGASGADQQQRAGHLGAGRGRAGWSEPAPIATAGLALIDSSAFPIQRRKTTHLKVFFL